MYQDLQDRIDRGDVIILDGAVGTGLQNMGVPMHGTAWAAAALQTHPFTVRHLHEVYIKAGVDVLTTNTYSCGAPQPGAPRPRGSGDRAEHPGRHARPGRAGQGGAGSARLHRRRGLELRARDRRGAAAPGLRAGDRAGPRSLSSRRRPISASRRRCSAEAGVDFMLAESTGGMEHRKWVVEACLATGLPTWIGIKCRVEGDDPTPRVGYSSDVPLDQGLDELVPLGGKVINVFHSNVKATDAALPIVREKWSGPIGVYPEAGREDYVDPLPDPTRQERPHPGRVPRPGPEVGAGRRPDHRRLLRHRAGLHPTAPGRAAGADPGAPKR